MALFGDSNNGQLEALQREVNKLLQDNKTGSAVLAAERLQFSELQTELSKIKVELEAAKAAVLKARKRQKNSVERANRFKLKVVKLAELTTS